MLISEDCLICEETLAKCNEDAYLPSLHLSTLELRCKLQEKLHRVTWPLIQIYSIFQSYVSLMTGQRFD
jgi:hypothetical protein